MYYIEKLLENGLVLSKKSRFVGGSLLMLAGYFPLINSILFDKAIVNSNENYAKKTDCLDKLASSDAIFNTALHESINFSDIFYENYNNLSFKNITLGDKNTDINALIASLIPAKTPKNLSTNSASKGADNLTSKTTNVSPVKIVNVGEHIDARMIKSKIKSSFYTDARSLGIPASVIDSVIKTLSEKIDFRRSLNKGDKFEILYNKKNEMLYTKITTKKGEFSVYRFTNGKSSAYYFANGEKSCSAVSNKFFGLPLKGGLSVSDRFGWRKHPFTGRYHHHTGVDLRAAYGSPVFAIYEGIVTRASYYCGYGHCIDVKHASGYSSRYAHLSKYAVRVGSRVKKGQIIGNVGSSGISTGAHLHLELARNNSVLNPLSVKMMPTEKASVTDKYKFNILKKKISNTFNTI